jgi:hypothetical protein
MIAVLPAPAVWPAPEGIYSHTIDLDWRAGGTQYPRLANHP